MKNGRLKHPTRLFAQLARLMETGENGLPPREIQLKTFWAKDSHGIEAESRHRFRYASQAVEYLASRIQNPAACRLVLEVWSFGETDAWGEPLHLIWAKTWEAER